MKIGLIGATGKLGSLILENLTNQKISTIIISKNIMSNFDSFKDIFTQSNEGLILLDVSLPTGTESLCKNISLLDDLSLKKIKGVVIGTTGHNKTQIEMLQNISNKVAMCIVSNFSKGVYLFEELLKAKTSNGLSFIELASSLGFDVAMHEIHHNQKKDAPSGTALTLAQAAQLNPSKISSTRVGKVIGEHSLYLSSLFEDIEIRHTAHTRMLFAQGAVEICKNIYATSPPPGVLEKESYFALTT